MSTFFTADTHFAHKNILKYAMRVFDHVDHMNDELILNYNKVVKDGDTVYHLGDFTFGDPKPFTCRLNGNLILIPGNHDQLKKWEGAHTKHSNCVIAPALHQVSINGQLIVLCHYGMRVWNKSHRGAWQLYGHSHNTLPEMDHLMSTDVGVDNPKWKYSPVSMEQLTEHMSHKKFRPSDHHGSD